MKAHERQRQAAALPRQPSPAATAAGQHADPFSLVTPTRPAAPLQARPLLAGPIGSDDGVRFGQAMRGDDRLALLALGDDLINRSAQAVFLAGFVIEQSAANTTRGLSSLVAETSARVHPEVVPDKFVKLFSIPAASCSARLRR